MSDSAWFSYDYAPGFIDGAGVVLVRGGSYPARLSRHELPWKVHAVMADKYDSVAAARRIVDALNAASE